MKLPRRILGLLTLIIVVSALGAGIYWRLKPAGEGDAPGGSGEEGTVPGLPASASEQFPTDVAQPVVGAEVVRDTLWITVSAVAQAAWVRGATIVSQVDGIVRALPVRENSSVAEGDLLLQVDTTEYALALARSQADLLDAQARHQEMTLFDDEITDPQVRETRARLTRARSGLTQAEVALRQAELNLARTTVRAPFRGRVADLKVVEGQRVSPGAELMTIVDLDPIKVEAQVLDPQLGFLSEGRRATVTFAAFPGETFQGRIASINPMVDPATRAARVTVLLANPQSRIKPGMYAQVSLEARFFPDRILVPRSAILEKDRRTMLFVYQDGRAQWRYVTTGLESDELVEIVPNEETSMVEPGEIVLVDNHFYIVHDAQVRLVDALPAGGQGGGEG
jgi:membrane fusion protein, multidrug efflux system